MTTKKLIGIKRKSPIMISNIEYFVAFGWFIFTLRPETLVVAIILIYLSYVNLFSFFSMEMMKCHYPSIKVLIKYAVVYLILE
jgi:hypothetical protein